MTVSMMMGLSHVKWIHAPSPSLSDTHSAPSATLPPEVDADHVRSMAAPAGRPGRNELAIATASGARSSAELYFGGDAGLFVMAIASETGYCRASQRHSGRFLQLATVLHSSLSKAAYFRKA